MGRASTHDMPPVTVQKLEWNRTMTRGNKLEAALSWRSVKFTLAGSVRFVKVRVYTPFPSYIGNLWGNLTRTDLIEFWRILDIKDPLKVPHI